MGLRTSGVYEMPVEYASVLIRAEPNDSALVYRTIIDTLFKSTRQYKSDKFDSRRRHIVPGSGPTMACHCPWIPR